MLHGFGGVVDQVRESALEGFGVGEDEWQTGSKRSRTMRMVLETAGEEGEGVLDDGVEVGRARLRGGELGERGELVDEGPHGIDRGRGGLGAAADDGDRRGVDAALGERYGEARRCGGGSARRRGRWG